MKPENIVTLEKHRHHHDTLVRAFYVKGLNSAEKEDMLRVMREEFAPMANPDMWCGECIAEFIKDLYGRFDRYLGERPVVVDPVESDAIITKANFPKHKRR